MTTDLAFNHQLADAQLAALKALQAIITDATPAQADPARAKAALQLVTVRLRAAMALLKIKPRKIQPETAAEGAAQPRNTPTQITLAAIEAALSFKSSTPAAHTPPEGLVPARSPQGSQKNGQCPQPRLLRQPARSLLERAGTPQQIPRPDRAA